jgi:hypothetical protein
MSRYYVTVPRAKEHWGPYTRLLQAQDFARIGSQTGAPREVRRGKVKGKLVRKYAKGQRAWPTKKSQVRGLLPGELPRDLRGGSSMRRRKNPAAKNKIIDTIRRDPFLRQYFETALWSSSDESTPSGGEPMDANYDLEDFDHETLVKMVDDASKWRTNPDVWEALDGLEGFDESQVGHDFWLTRNGHGAGFWDGDWPEPEASILDISSKEAGEVDLYIGDDGLIYSFSG